MTKSMQKKVLVAAAGSQGVLATAPVDPNTEITNQGGHYYEKMWDEDQKGGDKCEGEWWTKTNREFTQKCTEDNAGGVTTYWKTFCDVDTNKFYTYKFTDDACTSANPELVEAPWAELPTDGNACSTTTFSTLTCVAGPKPAGDDTVTNPDFSWDLGVDDLLKDDPPAADDKKTADKPTTTVTAPTSDSQNRAGVLSAMGAAFAWMLF